MDRFIDFAQAVIVAIGPTVAAKLLDRVLEKPPVAESPEGSFVAFVARKKSS